MSTPFHRYPSNRSDPRLRTSEDDHRDHVQAVEAWFALHARSLYVLERDDAKAIYGWQLRTLESGTRVFGALCPAGLVVTAAGEYIEPDANLSPAFCAVQEGLRQRIALSTIAHRVAANDTAWETLMEPISQVEMAGKAIIDTALLILLDQDYGNARDAFWRVLTTWHEEHLGNAPDFNRADFDACVLT